MASLCWEHGHLLLFIDIHTQELREWQPFSRVQTFITMSLRRTTMSDVHCLAQSYTVWHVKRPMDAPQHMAHKQCNLDGLTDLEVPAELRDKEIPLEDLSKSLFLLDSKQLRGLGGSAHACK